MNRLIYLVLVPFVLASCNKEDSIEPEVYQCSFTHADSSDGHVNTLKYQSLLNEMTAKGVVGITMSIFHPDHGSWSGASGMADLSSNTPMKPCNISRVGSTVKTFTATTILILAEEEKLSLDDKISDYLNHEAISEIENADRATIRQLLQHSGGVYNYIQNLQFQTASLNDLVKEWRADDLLHYARGKDAYFAPVADVRYSNTGYILLGLLIEKIENKSIAQVFDEKIIIPLGLTMTQFAGKDPVPNGIVRGYIDLYSNLQVLESTYFSGWDYYTADGGLISNPHDMNTFLKALMGGNVISESSLNEMLSFRAPSEVDSEMYPISFGLGIFKLETPYGPAFMHSGDAIGYYANMLYFPESDIAISYAVNSNYGKIDEHVSTKEAMDRIFSVVFE